MDTFKIQKEKVKREYKEQMESINYWEKINKKFERYAKRGIKEFEMSFIHLGCSSNFIPDDESKIEAYAKLHGYDIIDEFLGSLETTYVFVRKDK